HAQWLVPAQKGQLLGSFAMTEIGHGSDVAAIGTTATFDPETDEFVIDTPFTAATKEYIGNAARDARAAVVFAQLITAGVNHGVHALFVPVRTEAGEPMPGVSISDDGFKGGLRGVDNGRFAFDAVRVPRTNLLDRYGAVDETGAYTSPIDSPGRRFFTMLGTLVQGRVSLDGAAVVASKLALDIAVRYGLERKQFTTVDDYTET
ncbi:acyl-CoA dehydrogenase, partial [Geobacillus sp. MMMUD3]|nr:acyl-CoA dehydrogenase [Geobacillus sp. MMMUD3]